METFNEILLKEKAKIKPAKQWKPMFASKLHKNVKKYNRTVKHKNKEVV